MEPISTNPPNPGAADGDTDKPENPHGKTRKTRESDPGLKMAAAFNSSCDLIASNTKKLVDAGLGANQAGQIAFDVFRILSE